MSTARYGVLVAAAFAGAAAGYVFLPTHTVNVDIREVWMRREPYLGKTLRVSGTLKRFLKDRPKDHYAVESDDGYRIGVEAPGLETLVGQEVTVVGTAVFDEKKGLRLVAASVTVHERSLDRRP